MSSTGVRHPSGRSRRRAEQAAEPCRLWCGVEAGEAIGERSAGIALALVELLDQVAHGQQRGAARRPLSVDAWSSPNRSQRGLLDLGSPGTSPSTSCTPLSSLTIGAISSDGNRLPKHSSSVAQLLGVLAQVVQPLGRRDVGGDAASRPSPGGGRPSAMRSAGELGGRRGGLGARPRGRRARPVEEPGPGRSSSAA